jgi:hypothetical protein
MYVNYKINFPPVICFVYLIQFINVKKQ